MQSTRPAKLIDPVCGMTVDVAAAEAAGRLLEHEGRTYAFCGSGCRRAFLEEPATYVAAAEAAQAAALPAADHGTADHGTADHATGGAGPLPVIDEGMRRWYESCSCCLGDAYPEIKAQLDAERAAAAQAPVDPGICEVAEAEMR
ncbi:MAG: YHS domain-containing protein [Chloroflexota bacterium]